MRPAVSIDIEATGPTALYSMTSLGACEVGNTQNRFYIDIAPDSSNVNPGSLLVAAQGSPFIPEDLKVKARKEITSVDEEKLIFELLGQGEDPQHAVVKFVNWLSQFKNPYMICQNAPFDWQFINRYTIQYHGKNPLGINCVDIKSVFMGMTGCEWSETHKKNIRKKFKPTQRHTHNALDDAIEQAEIYDLMLQELHRPD